MTSPNLLPAVVVSVFAWRMYVRMRRNIGRQTLRPKRLMVRIIVYSVLTLVLAGFSVLNSRVLLGLLGGLAMGLPLGWLGLRLTRFERTPEGNFYTPNPFLGGALSIILAVRLIYRLIVLSDITHNPTHPPALLQSPLTLCVFGLLAGYYISYSVGVLTRNRSVPA